MVGASLDGDVARFHPEVGGEGALQLLVRLAVHGGSSDSHSEHAVDLTDDLAAASAGNDSDFDPPGVGRAVGFGGAVHDGPIIDLRPSLSEAWDVIIEYPA